MATEVKVSGDEISSLRYSERKCPILMIQSQKENISEPRACSIRFPLRFRHL